MSNRGIARGRMFLGGMLLFGAVIAWSVSLMMSPHGSSVAEGTEHVKTLVVHFLRNSALGTIALCALAAWLLFPARRPSTPKRDWAIGIVLAVLVATSVYQLIWVRSLLG